MQYKIEIIADVSLCKKLCKQMIKKNDKRNRKWEIIRKSFETF